MKKQTNKAWMGAIALACTMGFTACSSDDDKIENINPTFDGNSVKTQFAINIPRAKQSRQSDAITQQNGTFRGMESIQLIPLTLNNDVASDTRFEDGIINLDAIAQNGVDGLNESKKVYADVDVPIGTNKFLFYGKATKGSETDAANGTLTAPDWENLTIASTANDITFGLEKIYSETLTDESLLHILNSLTGIEAWQESDNAALQTALTNLESLTAGSSNSILKAIEKLYNVVAGTAKADATDVTSAAYIANLIKTKIEEFFTPTPTGTDTYTLAYKDSYTPDGGDAVDITDDFPTNHGLPEGAARLTCPNHTFDYATTAIGGTTENKVSVSSITYPAELYYFANTELYASNDAGATLGWTNDTWTGWGNKVEATTRFIALKDKINYGVGMLTTNVRLGDTELKDNATPTNNEINVDGKLKYTGLLIGGQPSRVGWNFEAATGETFDQTIYDCTMNSGDANLSTTNVTNYTLVLDNAGSKATGSENNNSVNIAIELENNTGREFMGVDGVVADGAKFYLVAKLDPTATTGVTKPTGDTNVDRVFLKDYETTVNLTIKDLKNAYVTIPDLRATQLKLGLYVDLSWSTGITFDVSIGEDE